MSSALLNKKIKYWEHQLLDLGKRNRMISYRETKRSTLKLIEPTFEDLFQRLAINEETLTFQRSVDRETDIRVFSILSLLENLSSPLPVTIGDIKTEESILERQKALKNIRSKARLSMEEQGTNILYLSFGFIEWKDGSGASAQRIKSPLILVPAVLELESLNSPYALSKHEDDIIVNPTLQYYLKTEYGIDLPSFDADKDTISGYFESIEKIANQNGWKILKEVSLGLLSFLKISMYNDLIRNEERIMNNPVIKAMCGDPNEVNDILENMQDFDLDSIHTQNCYQVMSADSSQQEAILYSKNNVSFVMQGPPGTGKSQTITNIISEALADGKKVLFVSEKMAALQVVYRRLQDAHLADFCLTLHNYKANKKEILEQIGANLKLKQTKVKDTAINSLEELLAIRQELNQYAAELHQLNPELNISCYEVYGKLEEVNDAPTVTYSLTSPLDVTQAQLQSYLNKLKDYSLALQRIDCRTENNPWDGLKTRTTGYEYSEKMQQELSAVHIAIDSVKNAVGGINECPELFASLSYDSLPKLSRNITDICNLPHIPEVWLDPEKLPDIYAQAEELKSNFEKLLSVENEISGIFVKEIYEYDYNLWRDKLSAIANSLVEIPFIKNFNPNFFIENHVSLHDSFSEICGQLASAITSFDSINCILDTNFVVNTISNKNIEKLISAIGGNRIIPTQWFNEDLTTHKALITEAKTNAARLAETKSKILAEWEADVLTLDYAPMLLRYKTEYTNFFKAFKSQYKQDKKQLMAMSKNIIRKLSDDVASELLISLEDYHEQTAWFENNSVKLSAVLSIYYHGIESEWDTALAALEEAEKIKNLPTTVLSDKLKSIVARDHLEEITALGNYLNTSVTAFEQIQAAVSSAGIELNVYDTDFDGRTVMDQASVCLERLEYIAEESALLSPYTVNSDVSFTSVSSAIENLNEHKKLSEILSNETAAYSKNFDNLYAERNTDWDNILLLLQQANNIMHTEMYGVLKPIINSDQNRRKELLNISDHITKIFSNTDSSMAWLSAQFSSDSLNQSMKLHEISSKVQNCLTSINMLGGWMTLSVKSRPQNFTRISKKYS